MDYERGVAVRPAGAPMVAMDRPDAAPAGAPPAETAAAVAGEAREAGRQAAHDARHVAREHLDKRSSAAGERVGEAAGDARGVAEHLRSTGREGPARLADEAAERMERFATYLRESDTDRILDDIRRVGRTRPAVLVAVAAAVGMVVGRLVRASQPDDGPGGAR
jgi:hypothetical protein